MVSRPASGFRPNTLLTYATEPGKHFEQLTTTGPYAGVLEAFTTGVKLHTRYGQLWNDTAHGATKVWASGCDRVIDTAKYFSAGFFGLEHKRIKLEIVSEDAARGGDTLTPGYAAFLYTSRVWKCVGPVLTYTCS